LTPSTNRIISMNQVNFLQGDATEPVGDVNKAIVHMCNYIGHRGKGSVLAISQKWKASDKGFELGRQFD